MAYLNYGSWEDSREDRCQQSGLLRSRSPLRRLKNAAQDNFQERRQSQHTSFQVAGAEWNVDAWLSQLRALGCDPASLNKLVHLNKLDPKLAIWILLSFYIRIADGILSLIHI